MQSSNDATCCFMAARHAVDPGATFAVEVAVALESHEATWALNSVGAEPLRLQFQDQSASFVVAQAARAAERESAKCRIASPPCNGCEPAWSSRLQPEAQQVLFPIAAMERDGLSACYAVLVCVTGENTMDDGSAGLPASRPATINGRIQITPYARKQGQQWFGALRFSLRGHQLGKDLVLRDKPCKSATEAQAVAARYVTEAYK